MNQSESNFPRISIVTPNYNYAKTLSATIRSVTDQNYPNLEYVLIDGGSTDGSVDVIRQHEGLISDWCSEPDSGQYSAINKGFARSSGEIMGWINSDDIMMPWTLSTLASIFQQFPEVNWITGLPTVIQNGVIHKVAGLQPRPRRLLELGLYAGGDIGIIQQESTFWRRGLWETAGPLREDLSLAADFELWTRFARHSDLASTGTILGGFTVTGNNRSRQMPQEYSDQCVSVWNHWGVSRQAERAKIQRQIATFHAVRSYTGLRGVVRRLYQLSELVAPVITWDAEAGCFAVRDEPLLC